ncbi:LytTR family DNA-binding domain-containing protein [uncultured Aquimarina sp.]|uniref:LytR/AlgR family response regulator transcription factor n=1 Tax=uncultured Aquimarina sp. TaxID=575652 RepID=UPI00260FD5DC|nr:LytTR family DNA-binding domain-containing protein [uncultured Aquimarina sp.]
MKKNVLIIFGISTGISVILWVASVLKMIHIPDVVLLIQLTAHFLVSLILYSFFILILPKYLTFSFVKRNTLNQVIIYGLTSLIISIAHCFIYYFIYNDDVPARKDSFKIFLITFIFQNVIFIPIVLITNKQKFLSTLPVLEPSKKTLLKENKDIIHIEAQQSKEKVSFIAKELLFIKSSDNYSEFYFLKDNTVTRKVIRLTLKSIEEQLACDYIIRSHKSYIINLKQDIKIKGNANGTKIFTENFSIPVSRSKRNTILEAYERIYT